MSFLVMPTLHKARLNCIVHIKSSFWDDRKVMCLLELNNGSWLLSGFSVVVSAPLFPFDWSLTAHCLEQYGCGAMAG